MCDFLLLHFPVCCEVTFNVNGHMIVSIGHSNRIKFNEISFFKAPQFHLNIDLRVLLHENSGKLQSLVEITTLILISISFSVFRILLFLVIFSLCFFFPFHFGFVTSLWTEWDFNIKRMFHMQTTHNCK